MNGPFPGAVVANRGIYFLISGNFSILAMGNCDHHRDNHHSRYGRHCPNCELRKNELGFFGVQIAFKHLLQHYELPSFKKKKKLNMQNLQFTYLIFVSFIMYLFETYMQAGYAWSLYYIVQILKHYSKKYSDTSYPSNHFFRLCLFESSQHWSKKISFVLTATPH